MAQTKSRSQKQGSSTSRSSSTRSRSASTSRSGGAKRSGSRSGGASRGKARQQTSSASNNGMLQKAKVPATAAGIALIGIAGGLAASGRSGKGRSSLLPGGRGPKVPRVDLKEALKGISVPKPDGSTIDWIEEKAKGVGDAGYRVAELASEARGIQKTVSGEDS
jgi:hypothetical protein